MPDGELVYMCPPCPECGDRYKLVDPDPEAVLAIERGDDDDTVAHPMYKMMTTGMCYTCQGVDEQ